MTAGQYDLNIGPDELTGQAQFVRIEHLGFNASTMVHGYRAIGGGPTNVPRWETWPLIVYSAQRVQSMLKTGVLKAVQA